MQTGRLEGIPMRGGWWQGSFSFCWGGRSGRLGKSRWRGLWSGFPGKTATTSCWSPMGRIPICSSPCPLSIFALRMNISIKAEGRKKDVKELHSFLPITRCGLCNPSPFTLAQSTLLPNTLGVIWVQAQIKSYQGPYGSPSVIWHGQAHTPWGYCWAEDNFPNKIGKIKQAKWQGSGFS